jgi:site-specific recombinase XerD
MVVVERSSSTSFLFRLQHPFSGVFFTKEWCGEYVESAGKKMPTTTSSTQQLKMPSLVRRVRGQAGDLYELIFLDQQDRIIVPLTEWYRLRKEQGPTSTRSTYLACLQSYFAFLAESGCPWNAPPERLRQTLIVFHRDRLKCQIRPQRDTDTVEITLTRETPLRESTLKVMRAALRDFYLVMKDAGLYAFANPLSSDMLVALKREQERTLANKGAPDQAGIREETHEQSRRRPTAFLRQHQPQGWKPEVRKELADVRQGIHAVLDALLDSPEVSLREKAVLHLLQSTGARIHEVALLTVGGYQNKGIAGQAQVMNKGSYGREVKTIYFAHNPRVAEALNAYLEQMRPLHDPESRHRLIDVEPSSPLFLTERGTAYSPNAFYWHWYRLYTPLQALCPVRFSPHDLRHLFVTEYLIKLKQACGAGTESFDSEKYLREREAFGKTIMTWRSIHTIDIYDQSRSGEAIFSVLAGYQQDLAQRRYAIQSPQERPLSKPNVGVEVPLQPNQEAPVVWMHDEETLNWIKSMEQQTGQTW